MRVLTPFNPCLVLPSPSPAFLLPCHPFIEHQQSDNNEMSIGGIYRYHQKARPCLGEKLVLEEASFAPSRQSLRLMAEQHQEILSAAHPAAMRRVLVDGIAGGGGPARGDVMGSTPPLPPGMMQDTAEVCVFFCSVLWWRRDLWTIIHLLLQRKKRLFFKVFGDF